MAKRAKAQILNYRVILEKDIYEDGTPVYVTHVPTLGISDYGLTFEEALGNTEKLIKFHIESLIEEHITNHFPKEHYSLSFAKQN